MQQVFGRTRDATSGRPLLLALPLAVLAMPLGVGAQQIQPQDAGAQPWFKGLRIDLGASADSNITRSNLPAERLSDRMVGLQLGASKSLPLGENSQAVLNAFAGLEQFRRFDGLGKAFVGAEAEVQYRTSAEFGAPTFAINAGATAEQFQSAQRDGVRLSFGANARMALTDRIDLFAALGRNLRSARSTVFDTRDASLRFNLDYALASNKTAYIGFEQRRGDVVSSGLPSASNLSLSSIRAPDDAFASVGYTSYRFAGRTVLFSAGLNLAMGANDALDISWRRIRSDPRQAPAIAPAGPNHYLIHQLSLAYLKSF